MNQKKLTIITLLVVITGAVLINEFVVRAGVKDKDREVASFGERYAPEQIKWEQELAATVAKESNGKTVVGAKPSQNEKFLFEALEGKYEAHVVDGRLLKISVLQNMLPLELNTDDLVKKYAGVFKGAKDFEKSTVDSQTEAVLLKNGDGKTIGNVTIVRNAEGRVLSISIQ
jgi:hypothetical protein